MWQLLPIDIIHYILNFVHGEDFINVCKFIGRIKGKMPQQEQEKSIKYLWKRIESDLKLIDLPNLGKYFPLSVYRKYFDVDFGKAKRTRMADVRLTFADCDLEVSCLYERNDDIDELYVDFIDFSFITELMKISGRWESKREFTIILTEMSEIKSNLDIKSCTMRLEASSYYFEDILRPIPRFATFSMFKDEIFAIINKLKIRI